MSPSDRGIGGPDGSIERGRRHPRRGRTHARMVSWLTSGENVVTICGDGGGGLVPAPAPTPRTRRIRLARVPATCDAYSRPVPPHEGQVTVRPVTPSPLQELHSSPSTLPVPMQGLQGSSVFPEPSQSSQVDAICWSFQIVHQPPICRSGGRRPSASDGLRPSLSRHRARGDDSSSSAVPALLARYVMAHNVITSFLGNRSHRAGARDRTAARPPRAVERVADDRCGTPRRVRPRPRRPRCSARHEPAASVLGGCGCVSATFQRRPPAVAVEGDQPLAGEGFEGPADERLADVVPHSRELQRGARKLRV
jgi:hypothetical protein